VRLNSSALGSTTEGSRGRTVHSRKYHWGGGHPFEDNPLCVCVCVCVCVCDRTEGLLNLMWYIKPQFLTEALMGPSGLSLLPLFGSGPLKQATTIFTFLFLHSQVSLLTKKGQAIGSGMRRAGSEDFPGQ
jgi:hypothetical protein